MRPEAAGGASANMSGTLLERIEQAADGGGAVRRTTSDAEVELSVYRNLNRMLNTRRGSCLTCPDYGIVELSEVVHDLQEAVLALQRAMKDCIQRYEPRLTWVQVRHLRSALEHELFLEFEIVAQLVLPDGRQRALRYATAIDASGNVKLSG